MIENKHYRPMQAAIVREKAGPFVIEPARIRDPEDDEVLVKIVATGMCHTDMIARDQLYPVPQPVILGHEGSGYVVAVGPAVSELQVGDPVVLSFGYCGHCDHCQSGHDAYCFEFMVRNFSGADSQGEVAVCDSKGKPVHDHFFAQSSFATYALSRENNAVKISNEAPLELMGPLGCGIQTGAGAVLNALKVGAGDSFACFGAGAVGLSAVLAAKAAGASIIIAVDVVPSRLELAKELGATHVINSREEDPVQAIKQMTDGKLGYALESSGIPAVLKQSIEALGALGQLGVVGAPPFGSKVDIDINDLLTNGKTIFGIVEGNSVPKLFIPKLVELYMKGQFAFDKLVKFYNFDQINEAAADSEKGVTLKPIIRIA